MKNEFDPTPEERAIENRVKQNRGKIVKSLSEIKYQSSRHLCLNTGLSIDEILAHVDFDDQIASVQVGQMTAYFLKGNEPHGRLYNTGNNSFEIKAEEQSIAETTAGKPEKRKWTPAMLENLAAEHYSYNAVARLFGIDPTSVRYQVLKTSENTDAWHRGQERHKKALIENPGTDPTAKVEVLTDARFEHTLEHVSANGHSRQSIEKVKTSLLDLPAFEIPVIPEPKKKINRQESVIEVGLSGGSLAIAYEGNLFQMNGRERQLINDIADLIQKFGEENL